MGFSTLIDILGSTIIGGMLMLILFRVQDSAIRNTYNYGGDLIVQQSLVEVVRLLEHDFRKIGFCDDWTQLPDPTQSVLFADSSSIRFLTDDNKDGVVDTLHYFIGSTTDASVAGTPNPRDRMLFRRLNSQSIAGANLGVTRFRLNYFDALGTQLSFPVANPSQINTIQVDIRIENSYAYANEYSTVYWRQVRLAARNLRNR